MANNPSPNGATRYRTSPLMSDLHNQFSSPSTAPINRGTTPFVGPLLPTHHVRPRTYGPGHKERLRLLLDEPSSSNLVLNLFNPPSFL